MADAILDTVRDALEGPIDFEGQRLADNVTTNSIAVIGLIAFLTGYITQNITYTLWTGVAGTLLAFVAIVPPWPFFNKNTPKWLPAKHGLGGISVQVDGRKGQ